MAAARAAAKKREEEALIAAKNEETALYTERFEGGHLRLLHKYCCQDGSWVKAEFFDKLYVKSKPDKPVAEEDHEPPSSSSSQSEDKKDDDGGFDTPNVKMFNSISTLGVDSEIKSLESDSVVSEVPEPTPVPAAAPPASRKISILPPGGGGGGGASTSPMHAGPVPLPEDVPLPGSWPGVTVVKRRVVKIDLHENNLVGPLPGSRGNGNFPAVHAVPPNGDKVTLLGNLKVLVLFGNSLTGTIPTDYGKFERLQHVDLSHNQLEGDVPHSLFDIATLKRIHLEGNYQLTGKLPETICALSALEAFTIHDNKLSGAIPTDIGKCTKLTEFSIHHNKFTGVLPASLTDIKGLVRLYVNNNELVVPEVSFQDEIRETGQYPTTPRTNSDLNCVFLPQRTEGEDSEEEEMDSEEEEDESMTLDGSNSLINEGE